MMVERDYEELLKLFNKHKVKYCIIGAFAVGFYTKPRYSKDIDILVEASLQNGKNIVKALDEFGFGSLKLTAQDFTQQRQIVQLGYEPVRIDLLTSIEGVRFDEAWKHKDFGIYGKEKVPFIGLNELIKSKEKSNRKQDLADLDLLKKKRDKK